MNMNKVDLKCKAIQGAIGTFRPGGMLRHFGRKGVIEYQDFNEIPTFIF